MPDPVDLSVHTIQRIIQDSLTGMDASTKNALVATIDLNGAKVVAAFGKKNGRWQAQAIAAHEWSGENVVAGQILIKW